MNVFVLGGYGKTGIQASKLLAKSNLVTKITIAGRNLKRAGNAAAEIGEKATAVQVDGTDDRELTSLLESHDFMVNAATNDAVIPSIRAAIDNRAHYCDMAWAGILEKAVQLGPEAEAAGITAIIATGISPCISNLMGVQAARQIDEVKQFQIGRAEIINFNRGIDPTPQQWLENPKDILTALQAYRPFIGGMLKRLQNNGSRTLIESHDSKWVEVDPIKSGLYAPLARSGKIRSWPYFSGDDQWGMLPTDLSELKPVEMWFSPFPPPLDAVLREQALGVLSGETDAETATSTFYDTIEDDPNYWLAPPQDFTQIAKVWVRAVGRKDGRAARCDCRFTAPMWNVGGYFLTSVALVAAVRMILRGKVQERGVFTAENAFEPLPFLNEVAALIPDYLPDGEIIAESFDWLE
jgi:hypothetical protein